MPYEAFETADGHVVAGVWGGTDGWERFCRAIGKPELAHDEGYLRISNESTPGPELTEYLQRIFLDQTQQGVGTSFNEHRALFGPVFTFSQIPNHPQVQQAGLVPSVEHPTSGKSRNSDRSSFFTNPWRNIGPPPLLGQHTFGKNSKKLVMTTSISDYWLLAS
ncbi:hypothetical protein CM1200mP19_0870 [bacterium]|nr:MAG: hypothetical protein CM1200mP19_0870 [bacterium]